MLTVDALRTWGANVDEGLRRCMNNEAFYIRLAGMSLKDPNFDKLARAIAAGDAKAAFDAAHGLKGSTGNLSLTPIYDPICEITERLRGKTEMVDVSEPWAVASAALASVRALTD